MGSEENQEKGFGRKGWEVTKCCREEPPSARGDRALGGRVGVTVVDFVNWKSPERSSGAGLDEEFLTEQAQCSLDGSVANLT